MTTITSLGVGSGIDVESLLTKLMAVENAPLDALTARKSTYNSQISALGQISSALATLQDAVEAFSTSSDAYSYSGSVADSTIATATATSDAVAGSYSLEVTQLATTNKLLAAAGADPSAGGTLTIEVGSTSSGSFVATSSVDVTISAGATLSDVRLAINNANAGVSATIVSGAGGDQLVITSLTSGEVGQVKISSAALTDFTYDPDTASGGLTVQTVAQDAIVKVDGITIADTTSNTVVDAVTGVTLNLLDTNAGSPTTLAISNDTSALQTKLETFVEAYNSLISLTKSLTAYDQDTETAGVLNGDTTVQSVTSNLRTAMFTVPAGVSSAYETLSSLGVQFQSDGTLELDTDTLTTATSTDFASVAATISSYGAALDTTISDMLDTDGLIDTRTSGLNSLIDSIDTRSEELQRQLDAVEARYRAQFTALDALIAQLQVTSDYLTQQLASLNNTSNS
jgi:flagellar hook-associated protein 2